MSERQTGGFFVLDKQGSSR